MDDENADLGETEDDATGDVGETVIDRMGELTEALAEFEDPDPIEHEGMTDDELEAAVEEILGDSDSIADEVDEILDTDS